MGSQRTAQKQPSDLRRWWREPEGQSQQQATSVCLVKTRRVEEDAGVQDDRLPILNLDRPGWRRATHTCNNVYQIEDKIKFFMAEALRGVDSLIFDARLNRNRYHNANQEDTVKTQQAQLLNNVVILICQWLRNDRRRLSRQWQSHKPSSLTEQ